MHIILTYGSDTSSTAIYWVLQISNFRLELFHWVLQFIGIENVFTYVLQIISFLLLCTPHSLTMPPTQNNLGFKKPLETQKTILITVYL